MVELRPEDEPSGPGEAGGLRRSHLGLDRPDPGPHVRGEDPDGQALLSGADGRCTEQTGARGDALWRLVLSGVADPLVIADESGRVIEVNAAFTEVFGWSLPDGPFDQPYPWWPDRDSEELAGQEDRVPDPHPAAPGDVASDPAVRPEVPGVTKEGHHRWVTVQVRRVQGPDPQQGDLVVSTMRDVTREHVARERRAEAVRLSAEFATASDLTQVLGAAVAGFAELFDGDSTVRASAGEEDHVFTANGPIERADVDAEVWSALDQPGPPGGDLLATDTEPVHGLLLAPDLPKSGCRVWVQFHRPRRVTADERIVGAVLAQAFSLAVDRVAAATDFADRETHLTKAIESHRLVGQAVGILIERHRVTPAEAFARLRSASQQRNTKLHEIAARVIETGADPDEAS